MSIRRLLDPSRPLSIPALVTDLVPYWQDSAHDPKRTIPSITADAPASAQPFFPDAAGMRVRFGKASFPEDGSPATRLKSLLALTLAIGMLMDTSPVSLRTLAAVQEIEALRSDPLDALILDTLPGWNADWPAAATLASICYEATGLCFLFRFLARLQERLDHGQRRLAADVAADLLGSDPTLHPLAHLAPSDIPIGIEEAIANKHWLLGLWREADQATSSHSAYQQSFGYWSEAISRALCMGPKGIRVAPGRLEAARVSQPRLRHVARAAGGIVANALRGPQAMRAQEAYALKGRPAAFLLAIEEKLGRELAPEELAGLVERGIGLPGFPMSEWRGAIGRHLMPPKPSTN